MKKILFFLIIVLLCGIIFFIARDYNISIIQSLCSYTHYCTFPIKNEKDQGNQLSSAITGSIVFSSGDIQGNNKVSFYKNNDEIIAYGSISSSSVLGYSGTILANISHNKISYKNLIELDMPSNVIERNYRYFEGRNDGVMFGLSEKTGLIESSNLDTKNIIFVIEEKKEKIDIKTLCYDANEPGPGDRVANEISNSIETIGGQQTYVIYRRYDPSTLFNGEICTIKDNLTYKIFIENYSKKEIQDIVDSFHFIQ